MLRAVGHPVVVNPDSDLEQLARVEGWEILRLDRLGRKLAIAGIATVAVAASGLTAAVLRRTNRRIELPRGGR
jgi:hypothetical protein